MHYSRTTDMVKLKYKKIDHPEYKYELIEDYVIRTPIKGRHISQKYFELFRIGLLRLHKGYRWDGATCFPDFDWIVLPSAIHDCFYQMFRLGLLAVALKDKVDMLLREQIYDGSWYKKVMSRLVYLGVKWFGYGATRQK